MDFSPALLLPRRPIRRSYALHRPTSFCTAVRCYKLAAAQLYCGAYNKAVGCPEARLSHPRIQRSYALYPPGVCDRLGCILPLPPSETRTFGESCLLLSVAQTKGVGLETAGLLLISSCLINRLALEACASLATRNACSGVLDRLGPNPGRRQASVMSAPRLRSWLAS